MTPPLDLSSLLLQNLPWNAHSEEIWAYSSLILRRNLAKYPFPSKLSERDPQHLLQELQQGFDQLSSLSPSFSLKEKESSPQIRELVSEHFLLSRDLLYSHPHSSLFLAPEAHFFAQFLGMDHLELRLLHPGGHLSSGYQRILEIEKNLSSTSEFAFSPRFGYLTSDFRKCGTALSIQTYLHVPGLIHTGQLESTLASCIEDDVSFGGIHNGSQENLQELTADFLMIENRYTLGVSEEKIFHTLERVTKKLCEAEKTVRSHLKDHPSTQILDLISKSFGLSLHSYQLELKEALSILSLLKLGFSLKLLDNVLEENLRALFFTCRKGHLLHLFPGIKEEEIAHNRALFFKQALEGMTLTA